MNSAAGKRNHEGLKMGSTNQTRDSTFLGHHAKICKEAVHQHSPPQNIIRGRCMVHPTPWYRSGAKDKRFSNSDKAANHSTESWNNRYHRRPAHPPTGTPPLQTSQSKCEQVHQKTQSPPTQSHANNQNRPRQDGENLDSG